ncbi:TIGR02269 family lipoprotein [Myxococcus sp. K38C18041901]|uniref:SitA6 family polymorphic toxin lipoprotein n=1 Tax=Myxococcus guangdongensis TaxID=2906760 RepID=UPI0020A7F900|nr:TIGR02269 family lipoprotein [Myxococcus guangdongensis]MCP3058648.1 TIGR02269 family lipoprotein [Myxococcus guangdongensis]
MRALHIFALCWAVLFGCGCSTTGHVSRPLESGETAVECPAHEDDQCVTLMCMGGDCGFYRCEDITGELEPARFPPARPPVASSAPGSGPRRNWGSGQKLPPGAVMVFPHWNGAPEKLIPPSHQLPAGRFERHHIFPQAKDLAEWFKGRGINIHDYTLPIPRDVHQRIHRGGDRGGEWNNAWREFQERHPRPSKQQIFKHAGELIYRFQLLGGPIRPYHSRTEQGHPEDDAVL